MVTQCDIKFEPALDVMLVVLVKYFFLCFKNVSLLVISELCIDCPEVITFTLMQMVKY